MSEAAEAAREVFESYNMHAWDMDGEDRHLARIIAEDEGIDFDLLLTIAGS
jgi:hypothetical protein